MILSLFFLVNSTFAQGTNCSNIKNYKDFYRCSLEKHPKFEVSRLKAEEGSALEEKASQWKNPDLDMKSVLGTNAGESVGSTEVSLSIPLNQIWVRGAQQDLASAEKRIVNIEAKETLLEAKKSLIKDLYRMRQIDDEMELSDEVLKAFDTIRKQFRGRLARSPEQEITLNLVELASSDYELKRNHLVTEKSEISSRLKSIWQSQTEIKKDHLPPFKEKWPDILDSIKMSPSIESQKLVAESERALAEKRLVDRESWPEFKAGPVIERSTEGPSQYYSYGFNLSVSLPIFSINGGARKLASTRAQQAKLMSDYAIKKADLEKDILVQKYRSAVASLKKSSNREDVKNKHHRIDSLFKQGLASGALVIEAHRQITQYTESQHEHENAAIEAFIELKTLGGEDIEEIL